MIRYSLRCEDGHAFDAWFPNADGFEELRARGLVECAECGSTEVDRALMAPQVRPARKAPAKPDPDAMARAVARMRAEVEKTSDYVGKSFAAEARAIHEGTSTREKPGIWGEATAKEAKALVEDGIPIVPLPFGPREKQN